VPRPAITNKMYYRWAMLGAAIVGVFFAPILKQLTHFTTALSVVCSVIMWLVLVLVVLYVWDVLQDHQFTDPSTIPGAPMEDPYQPSPTTPLPYVQPTRPGQTSQPPPVHQHFERPSRQRIAVAALIIAAVCGLVVLLTPLPAIYSLPVAGVMWLMILFYVSRALDKREEMEPDDWQQNGVQVRHSLMSPSQVDRIRHKLIRTPVGFGSVDENIIEDIRHESRIFLYNWTIPAGLVTGLCLLGTFFMPVIHAGHQTQQIWWIWLLAGLGAALTGVTGWVIWSSKYYVTTNLHFSSGTVPPWFFPFVRGSWDPVPFDKMEDVTQPKSSFIGQLFNFGPINIATAADKHKEYRRIKKPQILISVLQIRQTEATHASRGNTFCAMQPRADTQPLRQDMPVQPEPPSFEQQFPFYRQ
jgi:hypothetical protein